MLRLHLLGQPFVEQAGRPVTTFRSQKIEALLYYLAAIPGQHLRSQLAGLLWPDHPEKTARRNLRYALWNIRQVVDNAPLAVDRTTAAFVSGEATWVDALEFERQVSVNPQSAVGLYRDNFLSGFELLDSPSFTDWLHRQQVHYRTIIVATLEKLADDHADRRRFETAITATRRLLEIEPWHENSHRRLMLLLALTRQRSAAIEQYRRCRQLLADELELTPEPETVALFERIQRGQIDPDSSIVPVAPTEEAVPFFGRADEHAWLVNQWQMVKRGSSRLALIGGEAGVGKTRLVTEVSRTLTGQGGLLLQSRCFEYSGPVAYQSIAEALRPLLTNAPESFEQLSDIWLTALAQLLPELREQRPSLPMPIAPDRYRLFEATRQLFRQLTRRQPLGLFVDDLHWADSDSLDLLGYLVQQGERVLVIGTYRPEETLNRHPLLALRDGLYRTGRVAELSLERLPPAAVAQLVEATAPPAHAGNLSDLLYQISAGNPFILLETLQEMEEQGQLANVSGSGLPDPASILPRQVQATIQRRLDRLAPASWQLLSLAAVAGREFDTGLLQSASGQSLAAVVDAVDDWLERQLVRQVNQPVGGQKLLFDFNHDLIRTVTYQTVSPLRRQLLHKQVATALEQRHQPSDDLPVARLGHHFHYANQHQQALFYLPQAARQAQNVYALPLALERYQLAEQHWAHLYRASRSDTPIEALRQRWNLLRAQADILQSMGQLEVAHKLLTQVETEISQGGDANDRLQVIVPQVALLHRLGQADRCRRLAREGLALASTTLDGVAEGHCHRALGACALAEADYTTALSYHEAALINYTQAGETIHAATCLQTIAKTYLTTNQLERTLACVDEAIAYAKAGGQQDVLAKGLLLKGRSLLWLGQVTMGLSLCEEAITVSRSIGRQPLVAAGLAQQAYLSLAAGQHLAAQQLSQQALDVAGHLDHPPTLAQVYFYCGLIDLGQAAPQAALKHFNQARQQPHLTPGRQVQYLSYQAQAALALGQLTQAITLSQQAVALLKQRKEGVEAAQRIYLNHHHVLKAAGKPAAAEQARQKALTLAQQQAAAISRAGPRQQFQQLPWNQAIFSPEAP